MKAPYRILAIVEGHGEQRAVPLLLRRWFQHRRFRNFVTPDLAIRASGAGALKCAHAARDELGIEHYVEIAVSQAPDGILVVLDADDECQLRARDRSRPGLGPELLERARRVALGTPVEVVVANQEYEAWFLAALDSLRRANPELRRNPWERPPDGAEALRDCKKPLTYMLGRKYEPSIDQAAFTQSLPFTRTIARRSRSYDKLLRALEALTQAARRHRRGHSSVSST